VLPVGQSDTIKISLAKIYCPRCQDIFYPPSPKHSQLDGAYFGTTFAHLFFQVYPELIPPPPKLSYIPRIFGFKIHSSSRQVLTEEVNRNKREEGNEDVVMANASTNELRNSQKSLENSGTVSRTLNKF